MARFKIGMLTLALNTMWSKIEPALCIYWVERMSSGAVCHRLLLYVMFTAGPAGCHARRQSQRAAPLAQRRLAGETPPIRAIRRIGQIVQSHVIWCIFKYSAAQLTRDVAQCLFNVGPAS